MFRYTVILPWFASCLITINAGVCERSGGFYVGTSSQSGVPTRYTACRTESDRYIGSLLCPYFTFCLADEADSTAQCCVQQRAPERANPCPDNMLPSVEFHGGFSWCDEKRSCGNEILKCLRSDKADYPGSYCCRNATIEDLTTTAAPTPAPTTGCPPHTKALVGSSGLAVTCNPRATGSCPTPYTCMEQYSFNVTLNEPEFVCCEDKLECPPYEISSASHIKRNALIRNDTMEVVRCRQEAHNDPSCSIFVPPGSAHHFVCTWSLSGRDQICCEYDIIF